MNFWMRHPRLATFPGREPACINLENTTFGVLDNYSQESTMQN